jgi:hypothetical protein
MIHLQRAPLVPFLALALGVGACSRADSSGAAGASADAPADGAPQGDADPEPKEQEPDPKERLRGLMSPGEFAALDAERGVRVRTEGAFEGYTLVMPLVSTKAHLVDLAGEIVHTWETGFAPGGWAYLLDDGSLLHAARQDVEPKFRGGGIGGIIRRLAPNGDVLWRFDFADELKCQHHDLEPLPNGNLLFIAWERLSPADAIALGRRPEEVGKAGLWPDAVFEVRPTPPVGGEIVWSWHAKDHLVQDFDPARANFGVIADRPGRIDINFDYVPPAEVDEEALRAEAERKKQMAALGYGGGDDEDEDEESDDDKTKAAQGPPPRDLDKSGDWMHTNAVDYDAVNDLIVLSSPELCEVFVIDHSTTTAEARGSSGGRRGKGGDILWRWGNPASHDAGGKADQRLFYQHDPTFLPASNGELRLMVFNNGGKRPDGKNRSEVLELVLPFDAERGFSTPERAPFGPTTPAWRYEDAETFYSAFISGARRLPNGNTLICSGAPGRIFEVTAKGEIVWDYFNVHGGEFKAPEHAGNAPPLALYRADRYALDHPGVVALRK